MFQVEMFGPANHYSKLQPDGTMQEPTPFIARARTLGEALARYCEEYDVAIVPYDGSWPSVPFEPNEAPKYFIFNGGKFPGELVDIHVDRRGLEICPKQDLSFLLEAGDLVSMGVLVC